MRRLRHLLSPAIAGSLVIASIVLPGRAETQTPTSPGEPPRISTTVPFPHQPGADLSCDEQIKSRFAEDPVSSRANDELGWCYLISEKFDDAAAAFQKSIQLIPEWIYEREGKDISHLPKLSKEQEEELQRNASPSL